MTLRTRILWVLLFALGGLPVPVPRASALNPQITALGDNEWVQLTMASRTSRRCTNAQLEAADTTGATQPQSRVQNGVQLYTYGGKSYLFYFGGAHSSHNCNDVEVFDIAAGAWSQPTFPVPTRISQGAFAAGSTSTTGVLSTVSATLTGNASITPPMVLCRVSSHAFPGLGCLEERPVASYVHTTRTVTISSPWTRVPSRGDLYIVFAVPGGRNIENGSWSTVLTADGSPHVEHYQDRIKYDPVGQRMIVMSHAATMAFDVATNQWSPLAPATGGVMETAVSYNALLPYDPVLAAVGPAGNLGFQALNGSAPPYPSMKWILTRAGWVQRGGYPAGLPTSNCQYRVWATAYIPDRQKHLVQIRQPNGACADGAFTRFYLYDSVPDTWSELTEIPAQVPATCDSLAYDEVNQRALCLSHTDPVTGWIGNLTVSPSVWTPLPFTGAPRMQNIASLPSPVLRWDPFHRAFLLLDFEPGVNGTGGATAVWAYRYRVVTPEQDFQYRRSQPGVLRWFDFDSQAAAAPFIDGGETTPIIVADEKASGAGSLRFQIPTNSGPNTQSFSLNFTPESLNCQSPSCPGPYPVQFGEGQEFYVQWRQRFNADFLNTTFAGGGGWKQAIIGEGDRPGQPRFSCTELEIVTQDTGQRGLPQLYHSCGAKCYLDPRACFYEPLDERVGSSDYKLQNAIGTGAVEDPFCLYSDPAGSGCWRYQPNEWLTFMVRVRVGTWYSGQGQLSTPIGALPRALGGADNSSIELWAAREGLAPTLLLSTERQASSTGYSLNNTDANGDGVPPIEARYGKVWLTPYHTGKSPAQAHPLGEVWYDELIISASAIAFPGQPPEALPRGSPGFGGPPDLVQRFWSMLPPNIQAELVALPPELQLQLLDALGAGDGSAFYQLLPLNLQQAFQALPADTRRQIEQDFFPGLLQE